MPTTEPTPTAAPKRTRAAPPPWSQAELTDAFVAALPRLGAIAAGRKRAWRWPEGGAVAEVGDVAEHEGGLFVCWHLSAIAPPSRCSWIELDDDDMRMARKAYEARQQREAQREAQRREAAHKAASEGRALPDVEGLQAQVRELTQRLVALEAASLRDAGVFKAGRSYMPGEVVSHANALWAAQRNTDATPKGPDTGWRLILKGGTR